MVYINLEIYLPVVHIIANTIISILKNVMFFWEEADKKDFFLN